MPMNPSEIRLSPEQQAYIARQAERTGRPWDELLSEFIPAPTNRLPAGETALEAAQRLGLVGIFDGPADLSTNPEHMHGFGE